jgi:hypothetical protein
VRCADCGVEVERVVNGRWGHPEGANPAGGRWSMCCRVVAEGHRLVSADYHYVQGETQRHWPTHHTEEAGHGNHR